MPLEYSQIGTPFCVREKVRVHQCVVHNIPRATALQIVQCKRARVCVCVCVCVCLCVKNTIKNFMGWGGRGGVVGCQQFEMFNILANIDLLF